MSIRVFDFNDGFTSSTVPTEAASASDAEASATAAADSEAAAATSEINAATSETNAATSESNAAASAAAAADDAALVVSAQWSDIVYITSASSPVSITDASAGKLYVVDTSGGAVTFNLPEISALTLSGPWVMGVKKTTSDANAVTINRSGTDTIDGATSTTITRLNSGKNFIPDVDGTPDDWTTISFGEVPISGDIVGTTDTQDISNKTFIDAITLEELASTPSTPSAGDKKLYSKTDGKVYTLDSSGTEVEVGSGGSGGALNLDELGDFEAATTDDFTFTTLTGSLTETAGEVGSGTKSLKLVSTGSGETAQRDDITIPLAFRRNQFLGLKLQYRSGADWTIKVYQATGDVELMSETLPASNDKYVPEEFVFGLPYDAADLYWIVESSAGDTLLIDNLVVTPDISAFQQVQGMELVGENILLADFNTASSEITDLTFDNLVIGERYIISGQFSLTTLSAGIIAIYVENGTDDLGQIHYDSPSADTLGVVTYGWSSGIFTASSSSVTFTTNADAFSTRYVAGDGSKNETWAQLIKVDKDAIVTNTTNFAPVSYTHGTATSIPNTTITKIPFDTKVFDDDGLMSSGDYASPRTGKIKVKSLVRFAAAEWAASASCQLRVYGGAGGTTFLGYLDYKEIEASTAASFNMAIGGARNFNVAKGDIISVQVFQGSGGSLNLSGSNDDTFVDIEYIDREYTVNAALPAVAIVKPNATAINFNVSTTATTSYKTTTLSSITGNKSFLSLDTNQLTFAPGLYSLSVPIGSRNGANWIFMNLYDVGASSIYEEVVNITRSSTTDSNDISWATVELIVEAGINPITLEIRTKAQAAAGEELVGRIKVTKLR